MAEIDSRQIYSITRPDKKLLTLYVLRCLLSGPGFLVAFLPCLFKYETLKYRIDGEGISMSWGVLWRQEIFVTYARIQDIHLSRGLLERWLGLATIQIQTASGSASAEMSLVGFTQYEEVRDFLYSKMRGARFGEKSAGSGKPAAGPEEDDQMEEDEVTSLLTEIRDELRTIRERLASLPS